MKKFVLLISLLGIFSGFSVFAQGIIPGSTIVSEGGDLTSEGFPTGGNYQGYIFDADSGALLITAHEFEFSNASFGFLFNTIAFNNTVNYAGNFVYLITDFEHTSNCSLGSLTACRASGDEIGEASFSLHTFQTSAPPVFIDTNTNGIFDGSDSSFNSIQSAVNAASSGDTIYVNAGIYHESQIVVIDKGLTIQGAGAALTTIDGGNAVVSGPDTHPGTIYFKNPDAPVKIDGFTFVHPVNNSTIEKVASVVTDFGDSASSSPSVTISNNHFIGVADNGNNPFDKAVWVSSPPAGVVAHITNNEFDHVWQAILLDQPFGGAVITGNNFHDLFSQTDGVATYVPQAMFLTAHALNGAPQTISAPVTINNNYFSNFNGKSIDLSGGYQGSGMAQYTDVTIQNNQINTDGVGISFQNIASTLGDSLLGGVQGATISGNTMMSITASAGRGIWLRGSNNNPRIRENSIVGYENNILSEEFTAGAGVSAGVSADHNWWGLTSSSSVAAHISGSVSFDPWYINALETILSNNTYTDAVRPAYQQGRIGLPPGVTDVTLTDNTVLNLGAGTASVSGPFSIGFTSQPTTQTIGGQTVVIARGVNLLSGTASQSITLTNSNFGNVTLIIPDNITVFAPSVWNGTIVPPRPGTNLGIAPSGFSVGDTVIEVGNPAGILLFNKPVSVILKGVTGPVAYRPSGSTIWVHITNVCAGTYDLPAAPVFPGECTISNGTDSKIVTYHLTTFGSLTAISAPPAPSESPSSGGGGFGGPINTELPSPTATPSPSITPSASPTPSPTPTPTATLIAEVTANPTSTPEKLIALNATPKPITKAVVIRSPSPIPIAIASSMASISPSIQEASILGNFGDLVSTHWLIAIIVFFALVFGIHWIIRRLLKK